MKRMLLAAVLGLSVLFSGCAITTGATVASTSTAVSTLTPLQTAQAAGEKFQSAVTAACNVLEPTIKPFATLLDASPGFSTFNGDLTLACTINSAIDLTSINSLISTSITSAQSTVSGVSAITATNQAIINAALGLFEGSLQNALAQYKAATAAAASATTAASTATAASAASATIATQ